LNAIIMAGGSHKADDPLYERTQGGFKSLLRVAGKPMLQWVLDALNQAPSLKSVYVVGLPAETFLQSVKPLIFLEDQGDMIGNLLFGARAISAGQPAETHSLAVSADIPLITGGMVEWMISQVEREDRDIYYNVIARQVMETRFPDSKRTYLRLRDGEFCGGDMNAISLRAAARDNPLWDRIVAARKNPLRQAALVGLDTLLAVLSGRLSLAGAEQVAERRLGLSARALVCPYAEIGMDVDKPFQLDLAEKALLEQGAGGLG